MAAESEGALDSAGPIMVWGLLVVVLAIGTYLTIEAQTDWLDPAASPPVAAAPAQADH